MSVEELETELAEVIAAMSAIRNGGQETELGQTRLRHADYETLRKDRDRLVGLIARARRGGGIRMRGATPV